MKKHDRKECLCLLKMFIWLLTSIVNVSNNTKCTSLNNQQCMMQVTFVNLHPNEYAQVLLCYPFSVNFDKYTGSCKLLMIYLIQYVFQTKKRL